MPTQYKLPACAVLCWHGPPSCKIQQLDDTKNQEKESGTENHRSSRIHQDWNTKYTNEIKWDQMRSNEIRVLRFLESWFALNLWNLVLVVQKWALHILSHFLSRAQEAKSRIYSDSGHLDEPIFREANCWGSIRWKFPSVAQFFGSTTIGTSFRFLQGQQFCHISRLTADTTVAIYDLAVNLPTLLFHPKVLTKENWFEEVRWSTVLNHRWLIPKCGRLN